MIAHVLRLKRQLLSHGKVAAVVAIALTALIATEPATALAGVLTPESGGSPNANDISTLYIIVLIISVPIFVGVEGTLIYSLVKYRKRRRGPEAAQIRGNQPLELGWTIGAAVIVLCIAVLTFVFLAPISNPQASGPGGLRSSEPVQTASINQPPPPGGNQLTVHVNGQQYLWRYDYPAPQPLFSYYEMVVPVNTTVVLDITSQDVAHSWWIPKLGGKADAIPGYTNHTWFKITTPGVYDGTCAELCGQGHADMRARVRAVPVDQFIAWQNRQTADIQNSENQLAQTRQRGQVP